MIKLTNICKNFEDKEVLKNLNFYADDGEKVCIMGPSGCGKTTLINIIMGLVKEDSGEKFGIPKKISAVFQEDRLCEEFSAIANVKMAAEKVKSCEIEKHLSEIGIEKDRHCIPVKDLSGGMKRRVAIVRAMLNDSELVIFDEAFKGLDDNTKQVANNYINKNLNERTLIMITHDEKDVALMGARMEKMQNINKKF